MLRVVHVVESSNPEAGTVAVCLEGLHETLMSRGLESKTLASAVEATRVLDDADIVHIHGWGYEGAHRIAAHASRAGRPYVVSPHGCLTFGPYNKRTWRNRIRFAWRCRRLIRSAAQLVALNPREEQDLAARRVHPRIVTLPYGLRFDDYGGTQMYGGSSATGNHRLLVLGSLHPRGGCVALLKAIAEIGPDANGWDVVLGGNDDGGWRKMLETAIRRKKSADRVAFSAASTVAQQKTLLAGASMLVSPGLHIGPPVSIIQAIASGVPSIASTCVAPPGLDGAIPVFELRREALRETLRSVLRLSDEARGAMGEKARTIGQRLFDWSVLADPYAQLYKSMA